MTGMDVFGLAVSITLTVIGLIDLWKINPTLKAKLLTSILLLIPIVGIAMYLILRPDLKNAVFTKEFNHTYQKGSYEPYSWMKSLLEMTKQNIEQPAEKLTIGLHITPGSYGNTEKICSEVTCEIIAETVANTNWQDISFLTFVKELDVSLEVSGSINDGFCAKLMEGADTSFLDPPPSSLDEIEELLIEFNNKSLQGMKKYNFV